MMTLWLFGARTSRSGDNDLPARIFFRSCSTCELLIPTKTNLMLGKYLISTWALVAVVSHTVPRPARQVTHPGQRAGAGEQHCGPPGELRRRREDVRLHEAGAPGR